jgi:phenylalanyl-tRNA synthetase beta chain
VIIDYPYDTRFGRRVRSPRDFAEPTTVPAELIEHVLGESLPTEEIEDLLHRHGYREIHRKEGEGGDGGGGEGEGEGDGDRSVFTVTPAAYRDDILHPVDVIEDLAIGRGYDSFAPILPEEFTVGRLSPEETLARRASDLMVGAGYQQVMSNILTSHDLLVARMNRSDDVVTSLVEIDNAMSANYAVLRDSIVPSLLAVEAVSSKALYPHRMYEIGECALVAPDRILGTRTLLVLGALLAHAQATFSELHSTLDAVLYYLGYESVLDPFDHPACLPGRAGRIRIRGKEAGWIGELNPECLERWGVTVPASSFELDLGALIALEGDK